VTIQEEMRQVVGGFVHKASMLAKDMAIHALNVALGQGGVGVEDQTLPLTDKLVRAYVQKFPKAKSKATPKNRKRSKSKKAAATKENGK